MDTVIAEGLTGAADADVLAAAAAEGRLLVTLDRALADVRSNPPGSHPGIVVLRLRDQGAASALRAIRRVEEETGMEALAGAVAVVGERLVRIRRPRPSDP
ncbi:MAG: DUF5615 family PIN-like protein [Actinomycetota bacterium]|nr:DUF5615 family PIN-like protein [Actinomycetota bacterium]